MIPPDGEQEISSSIARAIERGEQRIDAALVKAKTNGEWPCRLPVIGDIAIIADSLVTKYQKAGWKVSIVAGQESDELLHPQFEKP